VVVTVKGKSLRDGLQPPLTVTARGGQSKSGRDEEMVAGWSNKEMEGSKIKLDSNCPIQGFRMTADRDGVAGTGAVVRKPPKNEPAMGERALCRTL
jgi:hypothetical protein